MISIKQVEIVIPGKEVYRKPNASKQTTDTGLTHSDTTMKHSDTTMKHSDTDRRVSLARREKAFH